MIDSARIRQDFLDFFAQRGHTVVPSSPVVPREDPTLLFANAGMNQFKDVFLGQGERAYRRAASTQKCLRVSGKHNDLDEVGRDTYHHTLFEMLGNWSFGDYYKREAISWAWELLTVVWGLPKDKLYATVFAGDESVPFDEEAWEMWRSETDIPRDHILTFGRQDNFWEMGESGPCGPCTEIHIDRGDAFGPLDPATCFVNTGHARFIELWNLVFIQYNRDEQGVLTSLPRQHVDTGAGFERLCAVLQGKSSNYDTDVFQPLIQAVARIAKAPYEEGTGTPHRVIADHVRALAFAVADGATPSNEGRGYVLRRILRRASRFGRELGLREPFLGRLCAELAASMGAVFPELTGKLAHIQHVLTGEEESFGRTLDRGLERFGQLHASMRKQGSLIIPGEEAFRLYDTFGFPLDLTQQMAEEKGLSVDSEGFEREMARQRESSRGARKQTARRERTPWTFRSRDSSRFVGHDLLETMTRVLRWRPGVEEGELDLVLEQTPFYGESGGQAGDRGLIEGEGWSLVVTDTRHEEELLVHVGQVHGDFKPEQLVSARVEPDLRRATERNHSATHLLQAALREVLGAHVHQEGSLVEPGRLRFDFSHPARLEASEVERIEKLVYEQILADQPVACSETSHERALAEGVTALFGEKYGDVVRVVRMGDFSAELCGGTHVARTGQIGAFAILAEGSVAAGIRRIEAVTGTQAQLLLQQQRRALENIRDLLGSRGSDEVEKLEKTLAEKRELQHELKRLQDQLTMHELEKDRQSATEIGGIRVLTKLYQGLDVESIKSQAELVQKSQDKLAALLVSDAGDRVSIAISLSGDLVSSGVSASAIIKELAVFIEGKGGGRPNLATAGGKNISGIDPMLEAFQTVWKRRT